MIRELLCVATGGAVGCMLRYCLNHVAFKLFPVNYPWGTLFCNLIGCFFIGFIWALLESSTSTMKFSAIKTPEIKLFLITGILGGFTTFSSFGLENFEMLRAGEFTTAAAYILISNIAGIALVFAGYFLSILLQRA